MHRKLRWLAVAFALCATAPVVLAEGAKETTVRGPVTMRFMWWGSEGRHKATLAVIDQFTAKNPNVKIEAEYPAYDGYFQKLTTQLTGGTAPDLMQVDVPWLYDLSQQGDLFVDLYNVFDTAMFDKNAIRKGEVKGRLWGLPAGVICEEVFIYNKDFFKRFGVDPNTAWDWDNLLKIGAEVHRKDPNVYLLTSQNNFLHEIFMIYILQLTGKQAMANEDYTLAFTEADARQMFAMEKTGLDIGAFMPLQLVVPGQKVEHVKWQKGETGIIMGPTSVISAWAKASPFEIGATLMPLRAGTANSGFEIRPPMIISVNARSKAQKEAVDFLKYFFADETAVVTLGDVRGVPASDFARNILQKANKLSPVMREVTEKASAKAGLPLIPLHFNAELVKIFDDLVEGVGYGKITPERAATDLVRQYTEKLKDLKSRPR